MATTSFGGAPRHGELADLTADQHLQYSRWTSGTFANRPAAGRAGLMYYATDNGFTYYDLGTSWIAGVAASLPTTGGTITIPSAASTGLIVKGAASQTGDLQQWQTSAGILLASVAADGTAFHNGGATYGYTARFNPQQVGTKGIVVLAAAGQTANLTEWQDNTGAVISGVDPNGWLLAGATASALNTGGYGTSLTTRPTNVNRSGLIVKGLASQAGNLVEVQNSAGAALSGVSSAGLIFDKDSIGTLRRVAGQWGQGDNHGTFTDFNATTMDFGSFFVQGSTNGPPLGGTQYYNMNLALGANYNYTTYVCQIAIPRIGQGGRPGIAFRNKEAGSWGSWYVIENGMKVLGGASPCDMTNTWTNRFSFVAPSSGQAVLRATILQGGGYQVQWSINGGSTALSAPLFSASPGSGHGSFFLGGLSAGATYTMSNYSANGNVGSGNCVAVVEG